MQFSSTLGRTQPFETCKGPLRYGLFRARVVKFVAMVMAGLCLAVVAPQMATAQTISEFALPNAGSNPYGIAAGPDGALWFTQYNGNRIGRITTAGAITEFGRASCRERV